MNDPVILSLLDLRARLEAAIAARDAAHRSWQEAKHAAARLDDDLAAALDEAVRSGKVRPGQSYRAGDQVVIVERTRGKTPGYRLLVAAAPAEDD